MCAKGVSLQGTAHAHARSTIGGMVGIGPCAGLSRNAFASSERLAKSKAVHVSIMAS